LYAPDNNLRELVKIFGEGANMEKGMFPYDLLSIEKKETAVAELNLVLDKNEYFTQKDFDNAPTNSKISDKDYGVYLNDAKNYKNRWDYLEFYNVKDVEVMITPIKNMIMMLHAKFGIDMFSFLSLSSNANAIKHKMLYEEMDVNENYNIDDGKPDFVVTKEWAKKRADGYILQDKEKERDYEDNITPEEIVSLLTAKTNYCSICHLPLHC
jgi:hypothetical protein